MSLFLKRKNLNRGTVPGPKLLVTPFDFSLNYRIERQNNTFLMLYEFVQDLQCHSLNCEYKSLLSHCIESQLYNNLWKHQLLFGSSRSK
jgi:hypothetical protein